MNETIFELSIKNDTRVIPEIASFLSESAYKLGLSKRKKEFLCFTIEAVLELRSKAINEDNPEIKIIVSDNGSYFKFDIIDLGSPYILSDNQKAILRRKLVDKYSFSQNGRKGQCFSFLYKYEHKADLQKFEIPEEILLDEDITYRRLNNNDEDVLGAVNCLYEAYGYEYYHQNLYSVESFRKYISTGRYTPIIAENKHHQLLCYCALDENSWFEAVPELANLVTRKIVRGKGLASKMFIESERIAQELNYEGIMVSAVAYHPYTQKMANKFNYVPTAIEYAINPKGTGGVNLDRRSDCVVGVKIFNKTKKHDLYISQECNDMFNYIFNNVGLNYEIHNEESVCNDDSIMSIEVDTDTTNCFGKIDIFGKDAEKSIEEALNSEEVKMCDTITINVNMNHISSIKCYKKLKELGFICVGCIPGCKNGDYLLMQAFKEKPQFEKIVVEDNYLQLINIISETNKIALK